MWYSSTMNGSNCSISFKNAVDLRWRGGKVNSWKYDDGEDDYNEACSVTLTCE